MSNEIELSVQDAQSILHGLKLDPSDWKNFAKRSLEQRIAMGTYIVSLRMKGWSFRKIEEQTGIPIATASRYRDLVMQSAAKPVVESELAEELQRMDALTEAVWAAAASGDDKAIQTYLKISEARRRMLGLDKPTQIEAVKSEPTAQELEMARLLAEAQERNAIEDGNILEEGP